MRVRSLNRAFLLVLGMMVLAAMGMACGGGEPEERTFELEIAGGVLTLDPPVIKVNRDDSVSLLIVSDEEALFHIHGYDLAVKVELGKPAELAFIAEATGKFDLEFHPYGTGDSGGDGHTLGSLEVQPR